MITQQLTIPSIAKGIPFAYHVPGETAIATPLAITLLDAGAVTDAMLAGGATERQLVERALTEWWVDLMARNNLKHFRWDLHVQELEDLTGTYPDGAPVAWMCVTPAHADDIPRWTLARGIGELDALLPGFGQEVMSVLMHTCLHLPSALDIWRAADWAEWIWWNHTENDEELIEQIRDDNGYATTEEALRDSDIITRVRFYEEVPRWAIAPKPTLAKSDIIAAAKTPWAQKVVAACDALSNFASSKAFSLKPHEIGGHRTGHEVVGGCMVLLWTAPGIIGATIDEAIDLAYQSGECTEIIDAYPLNFTAAAFREYTARTEQIVQFAVLAERLLELIGDPV